MLSISQCKIKDAIKKQSPRIYYSLLTFAVILPLLRPGYILTLDMIWAPNRNYLVDYLFGNGIGGQMPFLALLQLFEMFMPSWAVQKIIIFSIFFISAISAHISVPARSAPGKYFAGTLYAINPFVYTRFLAGHYYLLLAYAFTPLAIKSFSDFLQHRTNWKNVLLWDTVVAIFDMHVLFTVFLIQFCIFLFVMADEEKERINIAKNTIRLGLIFIAVNMFWILPVYFSVSGGTSILSQISDPDLSAYTAGGTISGNVMISLAMMYGFWRRGYLYPFNLAPKWIFVVLFTVILFFTVHGFFTNHKKPLSKGLAMSGVISLILAGGITYPYFAPFFSFLFDHFFIFKGMRDSQKFVGVLVLVYVFLGSTGIDKIFTDFNTNNKIKKLMENKQKVFSGLLAVFIIGVPLLYTFTVFNGFYGQIETKDYPPQWYEINEFLNSDTGDFDVLFFPWHLYMTFRWSERRIANPAGIFFDKPVIIGLNAEVGEVRTQSPNPVQDYVGYLLEHKDEIDNFGELVTPLNVRYVVLAKDVDFQAYDFIYKQKDLELVKENSELAVFKNQHETARIRNADSLIQIMYWDEIREYSMTGDLNQLGFLTINANNIGLDSLSTSNKELKYTEVTPFKYLVTDYTQNIIFTTPNYNTEDWILENGKTLESAGLTSVYAVPDDILHERYIYYKPLTAYILGTVISLISMLFIFFYRNLRF